MSNPKAPPAAYEWRNADKYARNRVLRRLRMEAGEAAADDGERAHQDEYAYRAAIALLSREAADAD